MAMMTMVKKVAWKTFQRGLVYILILYNHHLILCYFSDLSNERH